MFLLYLLFFHIVHPSTSTALSVDRLEYSNATHELQYTVRAIWLSSPIYIDVQRLLRKNKTFLGFFNTDNRYHNSIPRKIEQASFLYCRKYYHARYVQRGQGGGIAIIYVLYCFVAVFNVP